jgi:hypothetical protein
MKTLSDHTLIYDNECPMCDLYTNAFIKTGMLDENGRQCYSDDLTQKIDLSRARNEIALVNRKTGEVIYGIDSLFKIVSNSFSFLKPVFNLKIFHFLVSKLYSFISYNRKVIAPAKVFQAPGSCTPDFQLGYRVLYIFFTWIVSSLILTQYSLLLFPIIPPTNFYREFVICGGQIVFQFLTIAFLRKDRIVHYLGNMMTISLAGALALWPLIVLGNLFSLPAWLPIGYFILVVMCMFLEHLRRVKLLKINPLASLSWVLYRLIVLSIIL